MHSRQLKSIVSENAAERETAAEEICQSRMHDIIEDLIKLLPVQVPDVREIICMVLGVLGGEVSVKFLDVIGKNDPETDVRIAAIISKEYAGKATLQKLQKEIRVFRGEKLSSENDDVEKSINEPAKKSKEKKTKPEVLKLSDLEDELDDADKKGFIAKLLKPVIEKKYLAISFGLLIIIASALLIRDISFQEQYDRNVLEGSKTIAQFIKERIASVDNFKRTSLNPDDPAYRLPKTLELRSIAGDTYGDLFLKVYSDILTSEEGFNTLGAFWRRINFGSSNKLNLVDLMELETDSEVLLFPNPEAINLLLDVQEGSISFQNINSFDPDLEINIRINSVVIK